MIHVNVAKAIKALNREYQDLSERERRAAMSRAINRALTGARAGASKQARKEYNVRARDVKKTIILRSANASRLEGAFTSTGGTLPISAFRPSTTSKGISVRIAKTRERFPGAFKATTKSGHKGIFARAQYVNNKLQSRRKRVNPYPKADLPITEVRTLAIPSALRNPEVLPGLTKDMQQRVVDVYAHELKFRSARAAAMLV